MQQPNSPYCANCQHYAKAGAWSSPCRMGGILELRDNPNPLARIVRADNSCPDWTQRLEQAA